MYTLTVHVYKNNNTSVGLAHRTMRQNHFYPNVQQNYLHAV